MASVVNTVAAADANAVAIKVKKPLNAYQLFINEKVAEIKPLTENTGKKYMELRALANAMWRTLHPVDESKPPRAPRKPKVAKEPVGITDSDGEEAPAPVKKRRSKKEPKLNADGTPKAKRAPTPYNMFVSAALKELKAEYADNPDKPPQKELMKLAAAKWREFKACADEPTPAPSDSEPEEPAEEVAEPTTAEPAAKPKKSKTKKVAEPEKVAEPDKVAAEPALKPKKTRNKKAA